MNEDEWDNKHKPNTIQALYSIKVAVLAKMTVVHVGT